MKNKTKDIPIKTEKDMLVFTKEIESPQEPNEALKTGLKNYKKNIP